MISNYKSQPILKRIKDDLFPRLKVCGDEEEKAIVNVFDGRYINSGPSGAPTRGRDDVIPTGRNFYSVDLRGVRTEAAWDLGKRSSELLLDLHLQELFLE